jgi:hypothetical protein
MRALSERCQFFFSIFRNIFHVELDARNWWEMHRGAGATKTFIHRQVESRRTAVLFSK